MRLNRFAPLLIVLLAAGSFRAVSGQVAGQLLPGTEGVEVESRIGEGVPLDLTFVDETGATVRLGDYFNAGKPVVLNMLYYDCPMLCNLILDGFTAGLKQIPQTPGEDFTIITVTFDPDETVEQAARQKARHLQNLGRPEAAAGWHFLSGGGDNALRLAEAIGFHYNWDERTQQYAHPAALTFVQPDGTISRYLTGIAFPPTDLRAALTDASEGRTVSLLDQIIMFCFQYDPDAHSYSLQATRLMQAGGVLTLLALGLTLHILRRRHQSVSPLSV